MPVVRSRRLVDFYLWIHKLLGYGEKKKKKTSGDARRQGADMCTVGWDWNKKPSGFLSGHWITSFWTQKQVHDHCHFRLSEKQCPDWKFVLASRGQGSLRWVLPCTFPSARAIWGASIESLGVSVSNSVRHKEPSYKTQSSMVSGTARAESDSVFSSWFLTGHHHKSCSFLSQIRYALQVWNHEGLVAIRALLGVLHGCSDGDFFVSPIDQGTSLVREFFVSEPHSQIHSVCQCLVKPKSLKSLQSDWTDWNFVPWSPLCGCLSYVMWGRCSFSEIWNKNIDNFWIQKEVIEL